MSCIWFTLNVKGEKYQKIKLHSPCVDFAVEKETPVKT